MFQFLVFSPKSMNLNRCIYFNKCSVTSMKWNEQVCFCVRINKCNFGHLLFYFMNDECHSILVRNAVNVNGKTFSPFFWFYISIRITKKSFESLFVVKQKHEEIKSQFVTLHWIHLKIVSIWMKMNNFFFLSDSLTVPFGNGLPWWIFWPRFFAH